MDPDFDLSQLEGITAGDPEFEREVLQEFLACAPHDVGRMRDAVAAGDADMLMRAAHTLKGSSGTIGARGLAALAQRLEHAGRERSLAGASALFADFEVGYAAACAFIEKRITRAA